MAKNGDCCGEPAVITAQGNSLDSPCKAPFLAQKSCREQTSLESTFAQSSHSTTATPRILEEDNQTECEKSAENQKQPQSKKVDSSVKLDSSPNAPFSVIASRDSGVAIYTKNTHSLESTFENNANKTHKVDSSDAPIFAGAEAVDCHDFACAKSRNDNRKNTIDEKVDSSNAQSVFSQNAVRRQDLENLESTFDNTTILKQFAKDSRICDEKSGLSSDWQGSYLSGDLRQSCRIADLSRKTSEAVQGEAAAGFFSKAQSSSKKPTPKAAKLASTIKTELRAFFKQFLPAMLGSSTAQIASFIDTILASFLASGAISYLYYANRIFQLPLAIFAIAISTALFPMVAKAIKANEHQKALIAMKKAFWFLLFMLFFCAVGGIMLREQIIWLLYEHGKFSRADTLECAMVFGAYMVGLVPFGCARIFSLYLYSRSQQALAAKISAISLLVGVVFSLVLMQFLGAFGLALAGSLSGFVLFALTIRAFGFGEFWAIICARNYALLLGFMLVCEVLLLALWLHYIQIPH
ncbi:lipid II flippase MurJ [Helicobacter canis]|uniref:lipid II flippase MurJ n=1 Tax=Helicobacter canis TaxID=29419 RepID=UPI00397D7A49